MKTFQYCIVILLHDRWFGCCCPARPNLCAIPPITTINPAHAGIHRTSSARAFNTEAQWAGIGNPRTFNFSTRFNLAKTKWALAWWFCTQAGGHPKPPEITIHIFIQNQNKETYLSFGMQPDWLIRKTITELSIHLSSDPSFAQFFHGFQPWLRAHVERWKISVGSIGCPACCQPPSTHKANGLNFLQTAFSILFGHIQLYAKDNLWLKPSVLLLQAPRLIMSAIYQCNLHIPRLLLSWFVHAKLFRPLAHSFRCSLRTYHLIYIFESAAEQNAALRGFTSQKLALASLRGLFHLSWQYRWCFESGWEAQTLR